MLNHQDAFAVAQNIRSNTIGNMVLSLQDVKNAVMTDIIMFIRINGDQKTLVKILMSE